MYDQHNIFINFINPQHLFPKSTSQHIIQKKKKAEEIQKRTAKGKNKKKK
jgi:hypothetical protein